MIDEQDDYAEFRELVAAEIAKGKKRELADEFECAVSTVDRWATGVARPRHKVRDYVIRHIKERLESNP